uniref:MADF domain-containing protein n=1 Tax=Pundamilia nyererei TaxID=303518 RepID=A0A3B4F3D9_9CICH
MEVSRGSQAAEQLIMAVSGFPSLYDMNSPTYRDLNMRSDAWRQVAEIVGVPGEFQNSAEIPARTSALTREHFRCGREGKLSKHRRPASPRPLRPKRKSVDGLLEEFLTKTEARDAQRERDMEQRDDVTLFLLSLAPAMRRLTAEKQSWVRTKMQQFLHEAEFGATKFQ